MRTNLAVFFAILFGLSSVWARPADYFLFRSLTTAQGTLPYRLFVPKNYLAAQKYPLVITFHGIGERGTDNVVQITSHRIAESWAEDTNQARNPCFVVSPQCPTTSDWGYSGMAMQISLKIIDSLTRAFSIDTNRLYATGLSLGGMGTWGLINNIPHKFAAFIPQSGNGGNTSLASTLVKIPIWCFHGAQDGTVSVSDDRNMMNALAAAGATCVRYTCNYDGSNANMTWTALTQQINGGATLLYTEYIDGGHDIWENSYDNPLLPHWVFMQSKTGIVAVNPQDGVQRIGRQSGTGFSVIRSGDHYIVHVARPGVLKLFGLSGEMISAIKVSNPTRLLVPARGIYVAQFVDVSDNISVSSIIGAGM